MAENANSISAPEVLPGIASIHHLLPFGCPIGADARRWREAVAKRVDEHLAAIDALIVALDSMDTDPDLEPNGDELDASALDGWRHTGAQQEDSEDSDMSEDDGDFEPSLGWITLNNGQVVTGSVSDLEEGY